MPEEQNGQMKWNIVVMVAVGLIGAASTQVDRLMGKGHSEGTLKQKVDTMEKIIDDHYTSGCQPSVSVRERVSALEASASARQKQLDRMEQKRDNQAAKLDRLIDKLSN